MKQRSLRLITLVIILMAALGTLVVGQPTGASIDYNATETKQAAPAAYINTSGGTFTTLVLSAETQNPRWKAYAGNVTGSLVLDDAQDYTIYDWSQSQFTGEVYTTRNDTVNWTQIDCAAQSVIDNEQTILNHGANAQDNINATFPYRIHKEFYVGTKQIQASNCRSTVTWVNDTQQTIAETAVFQEVLLSDGASLVYATPIEQSIQGFNFDNFDFQLIVPERNAAGPQSTPYYFWLEIS